MKKTTIEQLLTWAFTEELCKVGSDGRGVGGPVMANGWAGVSEVATLGTVIDRSTNAWGVLPLQFGDNEPDPDALKVGEAVRRLTRRGFDIPEGWQPFPEWTDERGLIAVEVARVLAAERLRGERQTGRHAYNLIVTCAVLGHGPDWRAERPEERMIMRQGMPAWFVMKRIKNSFGQLQTYEADGFDRRKRRPVRGAYRKYELSEMLRAPILSRLDWLVWQSALKLLESELEAGLLRQQLVPMRFNPSPWIG